MSMIPFLRQSIDILFFGGKGSGKTTSAVYYALYKYLHYDKDVFANFRISFGQRIDTLGEAQELSDCVFIIDDAENWMHSRISRHNLEIIDILTDFGKRNIDVFATSKRCMAIDVGFRDTVDYFCRCNMVMQDPGQGMYVDNMVIMLEIFDHEGVFDHIEYITNPELWMTLFFTREEVKKLY